MGAFLLLSGWEHWWQWGGFALSWSARSRFGPLKGIVTWWVHPLLPWLDTPTCVHAVLHFLVLDFRAAHSPLDSLINTKDLHLWPVMSVAHRLYVWGLYEWLLSTYCGEAFVRLCIVIFRETVFGSIDFHWKVRLYPQGGNQPCSKTCFVVDSKDILGVIWHSCWQWFSIQHFKTHSGYIFLKGIDFSVYMKQ